MLLSNLIRQLAVPLLVMCSCSAFSSAQHIAVTRSHFSLLCSNGEVFSWGSNVDGLLGDGSQEPKAFPVKLAIDEPIMGVYGRQAMLQAVTESGDVYAWGAFTYGQTGCPSWSYMETAPKLLGHVSEVSRSVTIDQAIVFLLKNGNVKTTGFNSYGIYGNGTAATLDSGVADANIDSVRMIEDGFISTFAVQTDGDVYAWGLNRGMIDSTSTLSYDLPTRISIPERVVSISASVAEETPLGGVLALTDSGRVYVWGYNVNECLGVSEAPLINRPTLLPLSWKCAAIATGSYHTVALTEDGTVWTWGGNQYGQLGYEGVVQSHVPRRIESLTDIVEIAAGYGTSFAIARDGRVWGWGRNGSGMLVDNVQSKDQFSPVAINVPCTVSSLTDARKTSPASIMVLPNPSHDIIRFRTPLFTTDDVIELEIADVRGVCVMLAQYTVGSEVFVGGLPQGVYLARLQSGSKLQSCVFILQGR